MASKDAATRAAPRHDLSEGGVRAERYTLATALELGRSLSAASIRAATPEVLCDLLQIYRGLRQVCVGDSSSAHKAIVLDEALAPLAREACTHTAMRLLASLRDDHLRGIGRGGLHALRDAVCLAEPWVAELNLARLDAELARRGPVRTCQVAGVTILADAVSAEAMERVISRVREMKSLSRAADALKGLFILLVPQAERRADNQLLFAHLKVAARRSFDGRLWELLRDATPNEILSIGQESVLASNQAKTVGTRLSSLALTALGRRPARNSAPAPLALTLSVYGP